ncbi:MAG TPA: VWA domain-containing protein [Pyrinomonadaceae bacterium]
MKKIVFTLVAAFSVLASLHAQQPPPTPPLDEGVVKISTDLIQIDVTVTDKDGKPVTGLSLDDFEIYENGEKQTISSATFISRTAAGATIEAGNKPSAGISAPQKNATAGTSVGALRIIAIVVDDLNLSFASVHHTRRALRRFVDAQMMRGDLVAIIRTGGAVGALQQFTSDKRLLHAAIEKIRWNPLGGSFDSLLSVSQTETDITDRFNREAELVASGKSRQPTPVFQPDLLSEKKKIEKNVPENISKEENSVYVQSSLGTVKYIMNGLKQLPGRKALLLFSDGISIGNDTNKSGSSEVFSYLQDVAETATRSSVVVYTFDARGMKSMSIGASDNTYEIIDGHRGQKEAARGRDFRDSQDGLVYFAARTGGKALLNSDDLNGGIQRALDEQAGYYLLAYQPDAEIFDPQQRRFNKLEVKVTRRGVNVSHRSGFFSSANDTTKPHEPTPDRQIANALMSPFTQNDIVLNVNALFADDAKDGPYIRSFLHIDARTLKFTDQPDGWKKATFDVAAATVDHNGVAVESKESKYTIRTKGATYQTMLERGFVYVLIMPVKKNGLYQYRVAVRDSDSGKIGSASQIVDVPDLTEGKLAISSLMVEDVSVSIWQNIAAGKVGNRPGQMQVASTLLYDTVLRQFKAGTVLRYGFELYNAKVGGNGTSRLETQARILQNDVVVSAGNLNTVDVASQRDPKRLKISGALMLKNSLQPGDYVLQLSVFDRSANRTASQLLPFEIVK